MRQNVGRSFRPETSRSVTFVFVSTTRSGSAACPLRRGRRRSNGRPMPQTRSLITDISLYLYMTRWSCSLPDQKFQTDTFGSTTVSLHSQPTCSTVITATSLSVGKDEFFKSIKIPEPIEQNFIEFIFKKQRASRPLTCWRQDKL